MRAILEFLILLMYLLPGILMLHSAGLRGSVVAPLGFIAGTALFVAIGTASGVCGISTVPGWTMGLTWLVAIAFAIWSKPSKPTPSSVLLMFAAVVGMLALVALVIQSNVYTYHMDSHRYMQAAWVVANDHYDWLTNNMLTKRMAAYPALIAPASMIGQDELRGFAPTLAAATVWFVAWLVTSILRLGSGLSRSIELVCAAATVALLVTNNRFLWHATYLNGHLLCAAYLLTLAASGWARAVAVFPSRVALVLQCLSLVGLVLVRAEGALLAIVAFMPTACSSAVAPTERRVPLFFLGGTMLTWFTYVLVAGKVSTSSAGLALVGAFLLAVAWFITTPQLARVVRYAMVLVEVTLWLGLCVAGIYKRRMFEKTISASIDNIVVGNAGWGSSASFLGLLVLALLAFSRTPNRVFLRFPVTTFIPLSLLLAFLRAESYRLGFGDSFARSFIHIVPLTVVLLATGFVAQWPAIRVTHSARLWAGGLALGALINVLQFGAIQDSAWPNYRAFHKSKAPVRRYLYKARYAVPLALARLAPGATIIVPRHGDFPSGETKGQLMMWGGVKRLRSLDYDPERLSPKLDIGKSVLSSNPKKVKGRQLSNPYVVLGRKSRATKESKKTRGQSVEREFIMLKRGTTEVFVETSLIAKDIKALKRAER